MKTLTSLLIAFAIVCQAHAQIDVGSYVNPTPQLNIVIVDTVSLARNCAYQKDFETADRLLTEYNSNHTDFFGYTLHSQVLYWMQAFDRSVAMYEKSIQLFPQPSSLHLDYARVLYSLNNLKKARDLLDVYLQIDSTNAEANIMIAYMQLWHGQIESSKKTANKLLAIYPGNADATNILNTIKSWTTPYVKTGLQIMSDDQPAKGNSFYAEGGVYKSQFVAPTAQAAIYQFKSGDSSYHSQWLQMSNAFQLAMKTKLKLKAGFFAQNGNASAFTGSVEASQQFAKRFSLDAAIERRPYQYTISSMQSVVMENVTRVGVNYNRNDKWFGRAAYDVYKYVDDNKIHIAYLWVLAPVVSVPHFSFSAGYAFRHADAVKSTFVSKQSLPEIINNWPPVNGINGIYIPYFTPENQNAHSVLATIKVSPTKKFQFTSSLNLAFSAKADNPYLYVDSHDSGLFVNRGFAKVSYTPITWVNQLSIAASEKFFVSANYSYDKLLYYKSHRGSIELKYLFAK